MQSVSVVSVGQLREQKIFYWSCHNFDQDTAIFAQFNFLAMLRVKKASCTVQVEFAVITTLKIHKCRKSWLQHRSEQRRASCIWHVGIGLPIFAIKVWSGCRAFMGTILCHRCFCGRLSHLHVGCNRASKSGWCHASSALVLLGVELPGTSWGWIHNKSVRFDIAIAIYVDHEVHVFILNPFHWIAASVC